MIADSAAITEVQHQLGHSNPSIMLSIYSHWFKHANSGSAAARLAKMVLGGTSTSETLGKWALRPARSEPRRCACLKKIFIFRGIARGGT